MPGDTDTLYDAIIIGAGMSGISAAARLAAHDANVIVLESNDRIGGRLYTDRASGSGPYELGCSWFHESLDNPLVEIAKKHGIVAEYDDKNTVILDEDGIVDGRLIGQFVSFGKEYFSESADNNGNDRKDVSLKNLVDLFFESGACVRTEKHENLLKLLQLGKGLDWSQVSGSAVVNAIVDGPNKGRDLIVVDGYDKVLNAVRGYSLPDSKIITGARVSAVEDDGKSVRVTASTGIYTGKYIIVTVPIGVLKRDSISFIPPLSGELSGALDSISVAQVSKIYVEFDRIFWDPIVDKFIYTGADGPFVLPNWHKYNGQKKLPGIFAIVGKAHAHTVEANPSVAFETIKPALEAIRTDMSAPVPTPTRVTVSQWTVDPSFCGSYSTFSADAPLNRAQSVAVLEKGHGPRIKFAGEHTTVRGATFAHGAYISGQREADYVLNALGK